MISPIPTANGLASDSDSDGFQIIDPVVTYSSVPEGSHPPISLDPDDLDDNLDLPSVVSSSVPRLRRHDRT